MITPSWGRSVVFTGWHSKECMKGLKENKLQKIYQEDVKIFTALQMVPKCKYL